jgi:hypothetical protein
MMRAVLIALGLLALGGCSEIAGQVMTDLIYQAGKDQ